VGAVSYVHGLAVMVSLTWQYTYIAAVLGYALSLQRQSDRAEKIWRALARAHQELWLFAPPGLLLSVIEIWHSRAPWLIVFNAMGVFSWWQSRNWPEDNHWKRRGKKAREAVARRAGRLVVVPVGASS